MTANPRAALRACLFAAGFVLFAPAAPGSADEARTKGLFLYHLAKYVTWPDGAFASDSSAVIIGVVGDEALAEAFEIDLAGLEVQGRDLKVIFIEAGIVARGVHVVYFPDRDYGRLRQQADLFAGHPAIRVAEHKRFTRVGDIGFVMRGGRVAFYVNGRNTRRGGLRLSSKFLRLASGVE